MALLSDFPFPTEIEFAKNPVLCRFQSHDGSFDPYAAQGATATVFAGAADKWAAGETYTVTYVETDGTTETVVFTASPTYLLESQIPDDTFAGTTLQYWEAVRVKVQSHHRIAPYFTVRKTGPIGGNKIILTAINPDPAFTVEVDNTAGFANSFTVATPDTTPDNYTVLMEVYVENTYQGGDYELAAQLENTPDSDGYLYFDISGILEAACRNSMSEPIVPIWATTDTELAGNLRRYYFRYTEKYGAPAENQEWQYSFVLATMAGGISQSIFAMGDFLGALDATDSLLTWMPDGRKLSLAQPEFLAFYNWDVDTRAVRIQMEWYDITDGSASSPTLHFTAISVTSKGVALLPVNPTLLGLDAEPDAYKYRVRVVYDDGGVVAVSQWRTYYIDRDYYASERYVQYLNGFGVPECVRCTGEWGKKLSVRRSVAETPLTPGYNEFATDSFQFASAFDQELTYRTGYITRAEAEVLQEMLIAGEIYDVSEEGYIPLRITSNSFAVTDTNEDLHSYTFAAVPRMEMRNFSKKNLNSLRAGAWEEVGGEFWFDAFMIEWELPG